MRRIFLLVACLIWVSAVSAQDGGGVWEVTTAESLSTLTDEPPRDPVLSPDGSMIAWGRGVDLCLHRFAEDETTCYAPPESFSGFGRYSFPAWSPDSAVVAFTDSFFDRFYEPDIWTFDVAAETFTNRTDDGVTDDVLSAFDQGATLDYLPTWNPVNGDLYFFRSAELPDGQDGVTLELHLLPLSRTEPKLVHDLSSEFPIYSVYRPPVISPDGTRMALIVLPQRYIDDPDSGVWVLDLKTGDLEQAAELAHFYEGLPAWMPPEAMPVPEVMTWAGNDALIVQANNPSYARMVSQNAYYIDLAAATVQPMVDFTTLEDAADLHAIDDEGNSPLMRVPRAGAVTPDGESWIYIGSMPGAAMVHQVALPPDGSAPVEIERIEPYEVGPWTSTAAHISPDGRALIWGYIMQLAQE